MYHYVRPADESLGYLRFLNLDDFRKQLDWFQRTHTVLGKDDFEETLATGLPKDGVVLTFDDGFKDHVSYVLPELERRGLWGLFYVATSPYHTGKLLDVHRIHLLLGRHGGKIVCEALQEIVTEDMLSRIHLQEFRSDSYIRQDNDSYTNHVKRTLNYYIDYKYREKVLDMLMDSFFPNESQSANSFYMSKEDLLEMHRRGMSIG